MDRSRIVTVAVGLLVGLLPVTGASAETRPAASKRVVTLYWYGKDFPANVAFERALRDVFRAAPPGTLEYFPEFLESNRFPGEAQSRVFRDYLRRKYADREIDAVIALSDASLAFLLNVRGEVFPKTPIVYHTFNPPDIGKRATAGATGVVVDRVFRNTLDVALKLHPDTREVLVIVSTPERDRRLERSVREELREFETRTSLVYLSDMQLATMLTRVKHAEAGTLVFYVRQSQDAPGNTLDPYDVLSLVTNSARVPVYSLASAGLIGRGAVGGYDVEIEACARRVAEM